MAVADDAVEGRLRLIADILGVPVAAFFDGDGPADAGECLRLWCGIRTDAGRAAALDHMRRILDEEGA